jgi:iron complex transport system ATP-binding protein
MIAATNIGLEKSSKRILERVNFELRPGEVLALIGPNGAGKSSLLRVVAGEEQDKGQVAINGKPLAAWRPESLARVRAVLSQQLHLPFPMPVVEVVALGRYPYRQEEPLARSLSIAQACLRQAGMNGFEQRDLLTLSGGEQQRVHFARVLAQISQGQGGDRYLLLDEPTASLDLAQQHRLLSLLRRIVRQRRIGVLVVLHDMNLAARYADRVLLLSQGRAIAVGSPQQVLTAEHISRGFGIAVEVLSHPQQPWPQIVAHPSAEPIDAIEFTL